MIKSELVQKISEQNPHLYQRDVEHIVNAILDEITGYFDAPPTGLDLWNLALDRNREARLEQNT